MSATEADEKTEYGAVETYTFYDAGSDYFMQGGIYWNEEEEKWDSIHAPDDMSTSWTLVDPSPEVQERWNVRQKAKRAARKKFKALFDEIKHGDECPVCGGEMYRVRNKPKPLADYDNLMFCGDCKSNTWYGQGMVGNFWVGVSHGINWELQCADNQMLLSDSTGKDCATRYKRGPDYYGEKLKEYNEKLREIQEAADV